MASKIPSIILTCYRPRLGPSRKVMEGVGQWPIVTLQTQQHYKAEPAANNRLSHHTGRSGTISSSDRRLRDHTSPNAFQAQPAPPTVPGWCASTHSRNAALIRVW